MTRSTFPKTACTYVDAVPQPLEGQSRSLPHERRAGRQHVAEAVEAGMPFFSISGSDLVEMSFVDHRRCASSPPPRPADKLATVAYADAHQEQFLGYSIRHQTISEAT